MWVGVVSPSIGVLHSFGLGDSYRISRRLSAVGSFSGLG